MSHHRRLHRTVLLGSCHMQVRADIHASTGSAMHAHELALEHAKRCCDPVAQNHKKKKCKLERKPERSQVPMPKTTHMLPHEQTERLWRVALRRQAFFHMLRANWSCRPSKPTQLQFTCRGRISKNGVTTSRAYRRCDLILLKSPSTTMVNSVVRPLLKRVLTEFRKLGTCGDICSHSKRNPTISAFRHHCANQHAAIVSGSFFWHYFG